MVERQPGADRGGELDVAEADVLVAGQSGVAEAHRAKRARRRHGAGERAEDCRPGAQRLQDHRRQHAAGQCREGDRIRQDAGPGVDVGAGDHQRAERDRDDGKRPGERADRHGRERERAEDDQSPVRSKVVGEIVRIGLVLPDHHFVVIVAGPGSGGRCVRIMLSRSRKFLGHHPGVEAVPDQLRPDEDDELGALLVARGSAEEVAQELDVAKPRYPRFALILALADEPAEEDGLPAHDRDRRAHAPLRGVSDTPGFATFEISCSMSRSIEPLAWTRGRTFRITPVLRNSTLFTTGAVGLSISVAVRVVTGISSPTWRTAGWLSTTTSEGEESTLTLVKLDSASSTRRGCASLPRRRLKPGSAREISGASSRAAEPLLALSPTSLLVK